MNATKIRPGVTSGGSPSREEVAAQLIADQVARQQLAADQAEYELEQVALVCRHGKLRSQCGLHR
jgi:hypothetical protein